jgi:hypothetical protein
VSILGKVNSLTIGGSIIGGSASGIQDMFGSGYVLAKRLGTVTIGGSIYAGVNNTSGKFLNNGALGAWFDIGSVTINGGLYGYTNSRAVIFAGGQLNPIGTSDVAIGAVTIRRDVERGLILGGVKESLEARNADAQIGTVFVGGDWITSSIAASVTPPAPGYYGILDEKMAGMNVKDDGTITSKINSVTIAGQALGTPGGLDFYGFVAEQVGAVRIGGTPLKLTTGAHNDNLFATATGDVIVHEV